MTTLQPDLSNAILEVNVVISSADEVVVVLQFNLEAEQNILIAIDLTVNRLSDGQLARFILVGDGIAFAIAIRIGCRFKTQHTVLRLDDNGQGHLFIAGYVGHAGDLVRIIGHILGDLVHVGAGFLVGDFTKGRRTLAGYRGNSRAERFACLVSTFVFQSEGIDGQRRIIAFHSLLHSRRVGDFAVHVCDRLNTSLPVGQTRNRQIIRNREGYGMIILVISHTGDVTRSLLYREGIDAGGGDIGDHKALGFVPLQHEAGGRNSHVVCSALLRVALAFSQRHGEVFVTGIVTSHDLLHRDFHIHLAVGQLGQEDQGRAILNILLNGFRVTSDPAFGSSGFKAAFSDLAFNPAIAVTVAVGIHLILSHSHSRPVIVLVQRNVIDAFLSYTIFRG
ncbi:MAG: hypothetical protein IJ188_07700 [Clostridia bacterium]|nr:hypothetical protein [Clostridia bacterium]